MMTGTPHLLEAFNRIEMVEPENTKNLESRQIPATPKMSMLLRVAACYPPNQ